MPKIAFIFPGQGAQYVGMGKEVYQAYPEARQTFEEAEDVLGRKLTSTIFDGPEERLTETRNSQPAIYVFSMALLRVLQKLFPMIKGELCAGLSLGEYTALTASGRLSFTETLKLVHQRADFMNTACEETKGTMAVIMGLDSQQVEEMVQELNMPHDLWAANFNCPGQVVISGTLKGVEAGMTAAKAKGAKRALPLTVHGAFHSGLMASAEKQLAPYIQAAPFVNSTVKLAMNVPGDIVSDLIQIKCNLIKQVTLPVRWEQGIRAMSREGVTHFIEIGCGKTLSGMNKRIGVSVPTMGIEKVEEFVQLEQLFEQSLV